MEIFQEVKPVTNIANFSETNCETTWYIFHKRANNSQVFHKIVPKNDTENSSGNNQDGILFYRSSHQRCSIKKGILGNFTKFTGKHLCQSLSFNEVVTRKPASLNEKGHYSCLISWVFDQIY